MNAFVTRILCVNDTNVTITSHVITFEFSNFLLIPHSKIQKEFHKLLFHSNSNTYIPTFQKVFPRLIKIHTLNKKFPPDTTPVLPTFADESVLSEYADS